MPWTELALFMTAVMLLSLYGLTVSGHFPAELRAAELRTGLGAFTMWATILLAGLSAVIVASAAFDLLPWYAIVIGGGAMLLAAPLLLRPFPDRFVNGRAGLVVFAAAATAVALLLWAHVHGP
jgi:hypothetical protein